MHAQDLVHRDVVKGFPWSAVFDAFCVGWLVGFAGVFLLGQRSIPEVIVGPTEIPVKYCWPDGNP